MAHGPSYVQYVLDRCHSLLRFNHLERIRHHMGSLGKSPTTPPLVDGKNYSYWKVREDIFYI